MEGLAHQIHLQNINDDGKEATFAPPTLPLCPSHLNPLPHTRQTTLDHPTVLFDIATQYKRDIPYTKDGTTTTQNKWPLATHTNTTVPDTPSSHLATTGHTHTHYRPNGGQLSARPCAPCPTHPLLTTPLSASSHTPDHTPLLHAVLIDTPTIQKGYVLH